MISTFYQGKGENVDHAKNKLTDVYYGQDVWTPL